jgi:hypothetical protein
MPPPTHRNPTHSTYYHARVFGPAQAQRARIQILFNPHSDFQLCVCSAPAQININACTAAPPLRKWMEKEKCCGSTASTIVCCLLLCIRPRNNNIIISTYFYWLPGGWECLFTCSAQLSACALKPTAHITVVGLLWNIMRRARPHIQLRDAPMCAGYKLRRAPYWFCSMQIFMVEIPIKWM